MSCSIRRWLVAIAASVVSFATMSLFAETQKANGYTWSYEVYGDKAEIVNNDFSGAAIDPEPSSGTLSIPSKLGKCPVTTLGTEAFRDCSSMTGVIIPSSVTCIDSEAFEGCSSLKSITIPSKVTEIGSYAFSECSSLKSVSIPDGVERIGFFAFENCESLQSVKIPSKLDKIEQEAFSGCTSLTSLTIPGNVETIEIGAFRSCTGLANLTINNGVRRIEAYAFDSCSSLASVTIPDSVTSIDDGAFQWCESLKSVSLPKHFKGVLDTLSVFAGCHEDLEITYRNSGSSTTSYTVRYCKYDGSGARAEEDFECGKTYTLAWLGSQLGWTRSSADILNRSTIEHRNPSSDLAFALP